MLHLYGLFELNEGEVHLCLRKQKPYTGKQEIAAAGELVNPGVTVAVGYVNVARGR